MALILNRSELRDILILVRRSLFKKAHFFQITPPDTRGRQGGQAKIIEKSFKRDEKPSKMIQKRFKTYSNIISGRHKEPAVHTTPSELGDTTFSIFQLF